MRRENSLKSALCCEMGGGTRERSRPRARWPDDIMSITKCAINEVCGSERDRAGYIEEENEVERNLIRQGNKD